MKKAAKPVSRSAPRASASKVKPAVKKSAGRSSPRLKRAAKKRPTPPPPSPKETSEERSKRPFIPIPTPTQTALWSHYLAASHGYLTRALDQTWLQALRNYLETFETLLKSRPRQAAFDWSPLQKQQLKPLLSQLTTRLNQLLASDGAELGAILPRSLARAFYQAAERLAALFKEVLDQQVALSADLADSSEFQRFYSLEKMILMRFAHRLSEMGV